MAGRADDDDDLPAPIRLMNFVSEDQLEEARKSRGARVDDGTAQRDRSLYEILKENKDKKDAEFTERFKHQPPKALDDDESEFLDKLDMSRREYEQKLADEEAQELRGFQAAVAAQGTILDEPKTTPPVPENQDQKFHRRKNPPNPLGMVIKVIPQAKKARIDSSKSSETPTADGTHNDRRIKSENSSNNNSTGNKVIISRSTETDNDAKTSLGSLVSYNDESEEDS